METSGATVTPSKTTPREFRSLKPLPCTGTYKITNSTSVSTFFFSPTKLTVQERSDGRMIARGLVPVVVPDQIQPALVAAMKTTTEDSTSIFKTWSGQLITDRNGGIYDSLAKTFLWSGKPYARKDIYESLRLRNTCASPYHGLINAIEKFADLTIKGFLVEVADTDVDIATLGAAILVVKNEHKDKWKLTWRETECLKTVRGSDEAQLVKCTMDELFGLSLAMELPVVISMALYNSISMDGLMEKKKDKKVSIRIPYFSSRKEQKLWEEEQTRRAEADDRAKRNPKKVLNLEEIKDATTFLLLRNSEKRAILRQSGYPGTQMPRPREGPRAVDAIMIPLLDEEVAYEVLRRLAETKGDFAEAAAMYDLQSKKPLLAKAINQARRDGDYEKADELCNELNSLSTLRFDPTDPDAKRGVEFDVEEWYWEQRKRVYGIIAA